MKKTIYLMGLAGCTFFSSAFNANAADSPRKMYFKFDGGYALSTKIQYEYKEGLDDVAGSLNNKATKAIENAKNAELTSDNNPIKNLKGPSLNIGVGYYITDMLRGDITLHYSNLKNKPKKDSQAETLENDVSIERSDYKGYANLYYDFKNQSQVTPFIQMGIGVINTQVKQKLHNTSGTPKATHSPDGSALSSDFNEKDQFERYLEYKINSSSPDLTQTTNSITELKGPTKLDFAYQLGLGVSYALNDSTFLDFTYKLENLSSYSFNSKGYLKQTLITYDNTQPFIQELVYQAVQNFQVKRAWQNTFSAGLRIEF